MSERTGKVPEVIESIIAHIEDSGYRKAEVARHKAISLMERVLGEHGSTDNAGLKATPRVEVETGNVKYAFWLAQARSEGKEDIVTLIKTVPVENYDIQEYNLFKFEGESLFGNYGESLLEDEVTINECVSVLEFIDKQLSFSRMLAQA